MKFLEQIVGFYSRVLGYVKSKKGQTLVEYVLILIMVSLAIIVALLFLQAKIENTYNNAATRMP